MNLLFRILNYLKKKNRVHPDTNKRRINVDNLENKPIIFNSFTKINFNSFNSLCYQECLLKRIDNLFNNISDNSKIIKVKKRSYVVCKLYKIPISELPIKIKSLDSYFTLKEYISADDYHWEYLKYRTLNEVFFQILTLNETTIQTPEVYFWGYNYSKKTTYIGMFYIDNNTFTTINNIPANSNNFLLLDKYYDYVYESFQKHHFFHNDLLNSGNILTSKETPFRNNNHSFVIDFGEADINNQNPFEIRSPSIFLKKEDD